jgi:hypothetical protein
MTKSSGTNLDGAKRRPEGLGTGMGPSKPLRFALLLALPLILLACSPPAARAQSPAPQSSAQCSFDPVKSLAGKWEGTLTTDRVQ